MRYDDEFNEEMARRADLQAMLNDHDDVKLAGLAITIGAALLLYVVGMLFIPVEGLHFLWAGLAVWLVVRIAERIKLYIFRRQIASEFQKFPPETWQSEAWRKFDES